MDPPQASADDAAPRFSIERLSSAFARLMGAPAGQPAVATAPPASDGTLVIDDGEATPPTPQMIVEGMLFVGRADGSPLSAREIADPIRGVDAAEVDAIIAGLNQSYAAAGAPYEIVGESRGYRLRLRDEFASVRRRLRGETRAARLTPAAVEVLSLVAYRQGITINDIDRLRGHRSHSILAGLVRRELVRVERGRSDKGTVEARYHTTERFNRAFRVASPADLPRSEDLDDC
ncbi:MAG: SMC-Scp complex subunit ScpB [Pirellulales bacterium]|nr:SMC-Scp complex subunit ScpB [Pirellulales bacterium]